MYPENGCRELEVIEQELFDMSRLKKVSKDNNHEFSCRYKGYSFKAKKKMRGIKLTAKRGKTVIYQEHSYLALDISIRKFISKVIALSR